ncbi:hypothetical protein QQO69_10725 [Clostridioides difficile]|uniref:hypothetical protein n=1 Tax=Clostridioides difficile TaxID=1496 RepID=UPI0007BBEDC8|nr:hypothetical protein [Clostridioides difficile]MDL0335901.1 hypothetical protein [Clostridioides difficile]CZR72837.1 hypothetical protein [Clostridium difficile 630] [Clostridioides difficile]CZR78060.1 hypothetical protein CDFC105_41304 [Clostridioides difficile]CZR84573.1 hypothetical protein CDFC105_11321 [Clostridioides difficile]CZS04359.1 hypothetical protein CDFC105_91385 [Clostridioides difficile]
MENKKDILFKETDKRLHNYKYLDIKIKNINLDIKRCENEYSGCGAMVYTEKISNTYNISSSVENEVLKREERLRKLKMEKEDIEIEKEKIENALTCLNDIEMEFFNLFYNSKTKNNMTYISMKLHLDRTSCYNLKKKMIFKLSEIL